MRAAFRIFLFLFICSSASARVGETFASLSNRIGPHESLEDVRVAGESLKKGVWVIGHRKLTAYFTLDGMVVLEKVDLPRGDREETLRLFVNAQRSEEPRRTRPELWHPLNGDFILIGTGDAAERITDWRRGDEIFYWVDTRIIRGGFSDVISEVVAVRRGDTVFAFNREGLRILRGLETNPF